MLNGLDLFSGIGGLSVALAPWVRPFAYCEIDPYAQGVICSRIASGELSWAPIWDDITNFDGKEWRGRIDIVYGGFPCQDISVAGRGAGLEGERSALFFEILRIVDEIKPTFVFLENVPAIRTRGAERVVKELARRGYDCRWDVVSAAEVGAPHLRKRWFLLAADTKRFELREQSGRLGGQNWEDATLTRKYGPTQSMADSDFQSLEVIGEQSTRSECPPTERGSSLVNSESIGRNESRTEHEIWSGRETPSGAGWWATEPDVGRVANGIPARVDRVRALGNAVVPLQAREAFERLMGLKRYNEVA